VADMKYIIDQDGDVGFCSDDLMLLVFPMVEGRTEEDFRRAAGVAARGLRHGVGYHRGHCVAEGLESFRTVSRAEAQKAWTNG